LGTAASGDVGAVMRSRLLAGESLSASWHNNSIYVSKIGDTGLSCVFLRPEAFADDAVKSMYSVMIIMAAVSLLLCALVAAYLAGSLTKPLKNLTGAMEEIQKGKLDTRIRSPRQDELGRLSGSFNTMARELKDYMEKQVRQQKELNDASIAMMQAQLNPHFLYNTLDTMKWVAKANHIPEVATLAAKLAKILRTSISQAQFITLKEELELVACYAEIQKIRLNGKFCFEYQLPEELAGLKIPKLIIQPIVENAVIHGLDDCEEGHIWIKAWQEEGQLLIEVTDDGCGINEEVMEHLNSRNREQLSGHIGFCNVDTIIRLHYGEAYGLQVERPAGGGTRVRIAIPVRKEEH
jgi:two-component system sensor histidine kinase YesM